MNRYRILPLLALLPLSLLLSGCLEDVIQTACDIAPSSAFGDGEGGADHCYQTAGIQGGDPSKCEKIEGKAFGGGSNPPKDKCYLEIAENTGDLSVCDKIEGGFMSYTPEECRRNTLGTGSPEDCAGREDEAACRKAYGQAGRGCGDGYIFNINSHDCHPAEYASSSSQAGSDDGIDSAVANDLHTMKDAATGKYMELLEKDIDSETDPARLAGLQAYKDFLEQAGEKLETAQATVEKLQEIKRIFLDSYDPSMDIDRMPVDKILEKGLFDRIKDKLFGGGEETPAQKEASLAGDSLTVYQAMLKRQGEIDFLKKDKLSRLGGEISSKLQDEGTSKIKETAQGIAEDIAGPAMSAVGIVDHALSAFQEEAKNQMFSSLAKAYIRRREDLEAKFPNLSPEEIHQKTVQQVKDDPYQDNTNTGFVKFGNLLENPDCKDASNPLCIDNAVWWTAMDKTYRHAKK